MSEKKPPRKDDGGGAGWIMTFADLMSLLMCFFVLLLSFAELDVMKFKAIAGSMKLAFGVQREIRAIEVPKGTSIVAQEFSAGRPDPTVMNEIRQETMDDDKQSLEFTDALVDDPDGNRPEETDGGADRAEQQTRLDARRLMEALRSEIDAGTIEVETQDTSIIIRIREKGSFPSGRASFDPAFKPVIAKLRDSLGTVEGTVAVAGHTDDIPIKTNLYRSNWDLSSARAVSVLHALLDGSSLDPARFVVEGHGDAHPLQPNDSPEHRALNRRVEITIRQTPHHGAGHGDAPTAPPAAPASDATAASMAPADVAAAVPDWVPRPPDSADWVPQDVVPATPAEASAASSGAQAAPANVPVAPPSAPTEADPDASTPPAAGSPDWSQPLEPPPSAPASDWSQPAQPPAPAPDWSQPSAPTPATAAPDWSQPVAPPTAAPANAAGAIPAATTSPQPPSRLSRIRDGMSSR